ncbi:MAG: AsmA family protein, partial [Devosiaceae bacterium]|nr:AsmA family protein [Devosiaceae bacterium MH13]
LDRGPGPDPLQRAKSRVDLAIEGVQLGPVLSALTETPRLRGTASVDLMLAGTGPTLATLIQSVEGEVIGRLDEGAWDGADLSALAQSLAEGSGLDLQALAGGSTDITRLDARLSLGAGTLMVEDAMLLGEGFAVEGAGSAGIATQNLALEGAMLVDVDDSEPQRFPFTLGGTWTQPMVLPRDEESLPDAQGTTSP